MRVTSPSAAVCAPAVCRSLVLGLVALGSCAAVIGISATFRAQAPALAGKTAPMAPTPREALQSLR